MLSKSNNTNYDHKYELPDGSLYIKYEPNPTKTTYTNAIQKKEVSAKTSKRIPTSKQRQYIKNKKSSFEIQLKQQDNNASHTKKFEHSFLLKKVQSQENYRTHRNLHEIDIFISYSHKENKRGASLNWITDFAHDFLSELRTRQGFRDFKFRDNIWFDEECLNQGQPVMKEIVKKLKTTKVFIGLLSEAYTDSNNCNKEWGTFLQYSIEENNFYMIPIRPVDHDSLPEAIQKVSRSHNFCYTKDNSERGPLKKNNPDQEQDYYDRITDLADAVFESLTKYQSKPIAG